MPEIHSFGITSYDVAVAPYALLDYKEVVGVMTEDKDAVLYRGRKIYTNFGCDGCIGKVEDFEMSNIEKTLKLNGEKSIARSLIYGSYYKTGVNGTGEGKAVKHLSSLNNNDVLKIFQLLKNDKVLERCNEDKREREKVLYSPDQNGSFEGTSITVSSMWMNKP